MLAFLSTPTFGHFNMIQSRAQRSNRFLAFATIYLLAAAVALGFAVARPAGAKDPSTVPALKRVEAKSQAVAAKVLAATVGIINQSLAGGGHMGEGSGIVVSEDGLILTAGHVMDHAGAELTIIFPDGRRCTAKALGANFSRDTGVAKIIDPGKYPHVEMGQSSDLKPGAWCMALGHPGGVQQGRTPPIRLGRILVGGKYARFIVSDATVISGDSGGPLFDLEGRVIGIHSNIGMSVNQNQHVPIDVYRDQWTDLLAGKTFGSRRDLPTADNIPSPEKLRRFQELFFKKMMAGDPEAKELVKDGRPRLTPEDIDRLIAKWEKEAAAPAKTSAPASRAAGTNEPLDFLKFQRLFQERLLAGDPETLKLVKGGKMLVTPQQMHHLMEEWEGKSLAAGPARRGSRARRRPMARQAHRPRATLRRQRARRKKSLRTKLQRTKVRLTKAERIKPRQTRARRTKARMAKTMRARLRGRPRRRGRRAGRAVNRFRRRPSPRTSPRCAT